MKPTVFDVYWRVKEKPKENIMRVERHYVETYLPHLRFTLFV